MVSNEDENKVMQEPVKVKKEKVEIHENEPCCSTCTNPQDDMDEFIKTLNHDEIVSSIEIVKQLQKAFTDANQRETEEECTDIKREIKEEKGSEGVLSHPSVSVDYFKSEQQECSSSGPMTESYLDKLIQELNPDELDQSIEIVKQLQTVLVNADRSESIGEFSEIHPNVKRKDPI